MTINRDKFIAEFKVFLMKELDRELPNILPKEDYENKMLALAWKYLIDRARHCSEAIEMYP